MSYVITHGISMEPRVEAGDLVIVREAPSYAEGDVIAFHSASIKQPIMHRIVGGDPDGFVTQGDNNEWLDIDRPSVADVIGKEWIHIPGAGTVLRRIATPPVSPLLVAVVGLWAFAGVKKRKSPREKAREKRTATMQRFVPRAVRGLTPQRQVAWGGVAVLTLFSIALGILGFGADPVAALTSGAAYEHTGEFAYEADTPVGPVYRDGRASTGEPLFLNLIDEVEVSFAYRLNTSAPAEVSGDALLWARVSDGTGWKQSFRLQEETPFDGTEVHLTGTLDPHEIQALIQRVEASTGVVSGTYTVTLLPAIAIEGTIGGEEVGERFTPNLSFALDPKQLELASAAAPEGEGAEPGDPLMPRMDGTISTSDVARPQVSFLGVDVPDRTARLIALAGLILSAIAAAWLWMTARTSQAAGEVALIAAHYGPWMIPVASMTAHARGRLVEVATMDALARLAERYDRMILHEDNRGTHRYFVEEAGVAYYYQPAAPETGAEPPAEIGAPKKARVRAAEAKEGKGSVAKTTRRPRSS